jgi:hypothetical protein
MAANLQNKRDLDLYDKLFEMYRGKYIYNRPPGAIFIKITGRPLLPRPKRPFPLSNIGYPEVTRKMVA